MSHLKPTSELLVPSSALPCPECMSAGRTGMARIGNRRNKCKTCNLFAQSVIRQVQKRLKELYPKEFAVVRAQVEKDLYPQLIADWSEKHPLSMPNIAEELGL